MNFRDMNRWQVDASVLRNVERSTWKQPFEHKLTMKSGRLVPVMCKEVIAGDTFNVDISAVIRSITPAVPVMDNSFIDIFFFNVPFRLCTYGVNDWQAICGENFDGPWVQSNEKNLQNTGNAGTIAGLFGNGYNGVQPGSLANYLGLPIMTEAQADNFNNSKSPINTMKIIGFYKIWNEYFRDENIQSPLDFNNDFDQMVGDSGLASDLPKVCKIKGDPFTGALPAPQRGASVELPLGSSAPVLTSSTQQVTGSQSALHYRNVNGNALASNKWNLGVDVSGKAGVSTTDPGTLSNQVYIDNLYADLSQATASTINQIRLAFALQRYAERNARGGGRYRSYILSMYDVNISDSIVQVPEYLGGLRMPLNITQVLQNTPVTGVSPLGSTGAFSNTAFSHKGFVKSFKEQGYLYCVACIRTQQSYSQGISKDWYRINKIDFYNSVFSHIGEQPIYKSELYALGAPDLYKGSVFGYNEAWYEYRYNPTQVSGYLAPDANDTTLTPWTYTNKFTSAPVLNSTFMQQPESQIGDTLAVTNANYQFICDFYFDMTTTRPMPLFSIPGLLDHF